MTGLFVERFEARTAAAPDAVAVLDAHRSWTYAEVNARANRLAHSLLDAGIGAEDLVAVVLPRTADLVTALLAVLKSGAACLPVDHGHPRPRIEGLLNAARPRHVITPADMSARLDTPVGPDVSDRPGAPDGRGGQGRRGRDDGLEANLVGCVRGPEQAAYVISTSGSTGEAKAIVVPHRALAAFLEGFGQVVPLTPEDRVLAMTTVAFDPSVVEIHLALASGATVVLAGDGAVRDPHAVAALVRQTDVTVAQATPSVWRLLLDGAPDAFAVPRVLVGAEPLPAALAVELGGPRNLYGPTETTVWACAAEPGSTTIGRPLPGMSLYLLDDVLKPVPDGAVGEIYLAGAQVTRGYLHRPGATAERFVADPFGLPGGRMYRTGDRARRTPTGEWEFAGRADDQVKIRGNRVEPAEVTQALLSSPGVTSAGVAVVPDPAGGQRLVGFVTGADGAEVRRELTARLPEYLVPSRVVRQESLPVTVNGKLDRAALAAAATGADTADRSVRGLFAAALGMTEVGEDDDFFALGGHSLSAGRLVAALRAEYGVDVSIGAVFTHPTPAALAAEVATAPPAPAATGGMSPGQRRLWLANRMAAGDTQYHEVYMWRLSGGLDVPALRAALIDLVTRQHALRTVFPAVDGLPTPHLLGPDVPLEAVGDVAAFCAVPFDLTRDRPLRAALVQEREDRLLALVVHHIATDGPSLAPLERDLFTAYAARSAGHAPRWAPLPPARHVVSDDVDFWHAALAGLPDELPLPADRPRPAAPSHRGDVAAFVVDADLHHTLRTLAAQHGATMFMLLHAAVAALFTRLGAGTDIPLGTPVAGRHDPGLDDVVGFFAHTVVVRADTSGDPSFIELLARVRASSIAAHEHMAVPFDLLVDALTVQRSSARHPLFQTMLVLEHAPPPPPDLPGLRVQRVPWETRSAMFDLTFHFLLGEGIDGRIEYARDLFDAGTAGAFGTRLVRLLRAVAADPHIRIRTLPLLSAKERRELARWGGAPR
ncbi:amino acid adenylation domain-containing protein [Streptomyces anulatus]|uniref:amino acid adenylation domain-containing protein n=1 Tax=Streptomyces anulatus TaxID=1892 RepID=UPI00343680E8